MWCLHNASGGLLLYPRMFYDVAPIITGHVRSPHNHILTAA